MGDRFTEIEPYRPEEPAYEWDYTDEPKGTKILWGRVVLFGAILLAAFWLGRLTAPEGISEARVNRLEAQLADAEARAEAAENLVEPTPDISPTPTETPTDDETTGETTTEKTYVVQAGDTIRLIAEREYGDPTVDDCLLEANGIDDPTLLRTGQTLILPEACEP